MNGNEPRSAGVLLVLATAAVWHSSPAHAQYYTVTDLGTLGGSASSGTAINGAGDVVGSSFPAGNSSSNAFLYSNASLQNLGTNGAADSYALGMNDAGEVVGETTNVTNSVTTATLWVNSTATVLGSLGGTRSAAAGINDAGEVVGTSNSRATVWNGTTPTALGGLGGSDGSSALGINAEGTVVGWAYTKGNTDYQATMWNGTTATDLGTLGGLYSAAAAINNSGLVVGTSDVMGSGTTTVSHAFLYSHGSMQDLGTLGGMFSAANGINSAGFVVGDSSLASGDQAHAVLWASGKIIDLNSELTGSIGVTMTSAIAINDNDWIVADGYNSVTGQEHAYLLEPSAVQLPVPLPGAVWLMLSGLAGLAVLPRTRRC